MRGSQVGASHRFREVGRELGDCCRSQWPASNATLLLTRQPPRSPRRTRSPLSFPRFPLGDSICLRANPDSHPSDDGDHEMALELHEGCMLQWIWHRRRLHLSSRLPAFTIWRAPAARVQPTVRCNGLWLTLQTQAHGHLDYPRQRCDIVRLERQLCSLCPADTSAEPSLNGHGSSEAVPTISSSPLSQDSPRRPAANVSIVTCAVVPVVEAAAISDHRVGSYNRGRLGSRAFVTTMVDPRSSLAHALHRLVSRRAIRKQLTMSAIPAALPRW